MSENAGQYRREARRLAMTAVYGRDCVDYSMDEVIMLLRGMRDDWASLPDFTLSLCRAVQDHDDAIELEIASVLQNWRLGRIAPVERALLKLGCAEILYFPEIPPRVTINEYIELAKLYGNENAPSFINGILDKLVQVKNKPDFKAASSVEA